MSRAFVNEDSAAAQADTPVERRISDQPNYVTPAGLQQLQTRVGELQAEYDRQTALGDAVDRQRQADIERDLRYFNHRLNSAQVAAAATSTETVQIGSWVRFADEHGNEQHIQLVGEDQADATKGLINWGSPDRKSVV